MKEKFKKHKKLFIILIVVIAGAVAVSGFFLYRKKKQAEELAASMNQPVIETAVRQDIKTSFSVQGRIVGGDTQIPAAAVSSTASTDTADSPAGTDTSASSSSSSGSASSGSSTSSAASSSGDSGSVSGDIGTGSGNTVKEVFVKVGDQVKAGDPLYSIDMTDVQDSLWLNQQKLALQQRQNALDIAAKKRALSNAKADSAQQTADSNRSVNEAAEDAQSAANTQNQAVSDYNKTQQKEYSANGDVFTAKLAYEAAKQKAEDAQTAVDDATKAVTRATRAVENSETTDSLSTDESYVAAQEAVTAAQRKLNSAQDAYDDARKASETVSGGNVVVNTGAAVTAELNRLREARDAAKKEYDDAQNEVTDIELQYNKAKSRAAMDAKKLKAAKEAAEDALTEATAAKTKADKELTEAETAYNTAKEAYSTAQGNTSDAKKQIQSAADDTKSKNRDLAKTQSQAGADTRTKQSAEADAADAISSQQIANETGLLDMQDTIRKAEEQLAKGTIVAGMDGTVTAVNITPGQAVAANPVVISNLSSLKAVVDVEEAHIADVFVGQNVYMTTDSTGDETVTGQVTYCAVTPTTDSSASAGSGTSGTDTSLITSKKKVYYRVEVAITSSIERLRLGMNAKMEFVTAEAKDAIAVPNDTIMTDMDGDTCVYVMGAGDGSTDSSDTAGVESSSAEIPATDENGNEIIGGADTGTDIYVEGDGSSDSASGSSDTMTDSAGNVYYAVKITTGVTDGSYTEITSGNINEGDSLYGTGMTSDMTGMDGTDSTYTDNSQLLEGIYN